MKKLISGLLCLSCVLFADEFPTPVCEFKSEPLVLEKEAQKWNVLPYALVEFLIPGVGVCIRAPKKNMQLELNFKAASYPFTFVDAIVNFYSTSFSILPSIHSTKNGQIYCGIGGGVFYLNSAMDDRNLGALIGPVIPIVVGYEGSQLFVDLGADVIFKLESESAFLPLPTLRMGLKF